MGKYSRDRQNSQCKARAETIGAVADIGYTLGNFGICRLHDKLSNFGICMVSLAILAVGTNVHDGGGQGMRVDTIL